MISNQPSPSGLSLAKPAPSVRLGIKKHIELKRKQDLVELAGWSSTVAVTVMFILNGGLQNLADVTAWLGAIGRLTALVATNLLLIDILLISRVGWLEQIYGHDRLTLAHKKLGKPILYLVLAHFATLLWQYAMLEGRSIIDEYFALINSISDLLTASFALVAMILVVVTSLNISRKAIAYEAWYFIHILGYAAVLLAIPHQFSLGTDISANPIALWYWLAIYFFVMLNLLWYRLVKPLVRAVTSGLKVVRVERTSSDSVSVYLTGKNLEKYRAQAGQFYLFRPLTMEQWFRPHPFSLSAAFDSKHLRFTIGARGDDTALLQNIGVGTRVMLEGPFGVFTESRRTRKDVVLIASGIGIPPVRALAESLVAHEGDVTIIYRVRNEQDAALLDEVKELAQLRKFALHILAGPRGRANSWMNADLLGASDSDRLAQLAPNISAADVYICGPAAWTKAVERSLTKLSVPKHQVHTEEYAW